MRDIHQWFGSYAQDHRNPTNRAIHWICVPVIMWTVIAALWTIPSHTAYSGNGVWAILAMLATFGFYHRLSHNLSYAMAIAFIVAGAITWLLYGTLGARHLLYLAIVLFVLAWIGQFVGHGIEGRRPAFLTNVVQLLIGPAWLMGKLMRRMGIAY